MTRVVVEVGVEGEDVEVLMTEDKEVMMIGEEAEGIMITEVCFEDM